MQARRNHRAVLRMAEREWCYQVQHTRVAVRAAPSTTAKILAARRQGAVVRTLSRSGNWIRLHPSECDAQVLCCPHAPEAVRAMRG